MSGCSGCGAKGKGCAACGCGVLELTEGELAMLEKLRTVPFLPVARKAGEEIPVYLEESDRTEETYSLILRSLEGKGLIDIDYDLPLKGFGYCAYAGYPVRGSFALTEKGQRVLEHLDVQGIEG